MEIKYQDIENKIFVIPDNSIPITYLSLVFLIGNYAENPSNLGINNLCFRVLTRSTKSMSYEAFQYYLEKNSVSISSSGGNFSSSISISFPSYNYKPAIQILKEVVYNYGFRKNDILEAKRDLVNSIKLSRDDIWTYLYEKSDKVFYNSFLSWDVRGNFKTLKNISRKDLFKWYENKVLDKKVKKIMIISGYVTKDMINLVYKNFIRLLNDKNLYKEQMNNFDIIRVRKREKLGKKEVGICLVYEAPILSENSIRFKILNAILNSMSGRLFVNIREKKELAYAVGSSYEPIPIGKGSIKIMMLTSKEKKKLAIQALKEEINRITIEGFREDEIEVAKNYVISLFSSAMQKRSFRSALLGKIKSYDIDDNYIYKHVEIIKNTTLQDVNNLASCFKTKESILVVD